MDMLSLDFETRSLVDIKLGAWRYAEDPSTEILCAAFAFPGEEPELWYPGDPLPKHVYGWLMNGTPIRAWNAEFEVAIYTKQLRKLFPELPPMKPSQVYDTQAEAIAMALPAKLEEAGAALGVAEDHLKDPEGKRLIQYLCRPYKGKFREDPERLERLGAYCVQDVVAEMAIARKVRRLDATELELYRRNLVMNQRGLPVDLYQVGAMRRRWHELKTGAIEQCQAMIGISPLQTKQFTEWCGLENIQKKTVERAIEAGHEHSELLQLRLVASSTSLAKLDKLPKALCADGTMKGLFKYHGASTGRWVSQGGFNAQNLPRGIFEEKAEYQEALERINACSHTELASLLRTVFAFPMSVVDYSQIETRMLLWLADDQAGLQEFREGLDPYKTMAAVIYRIAYDAVRKRQRQIGKSAVLGAGYQLGWRGFIAYCDNMDITIREDEAQLVINAFRAKYQRVQRAWKNCQNAAVRAINTQGTPYHAARSTFLVKAGYLWVILPSGRRIAYKAPRLTPGREEWMGPQINFWGRDRYTRKWSKQTTYGGSLFQSITQGSARDVMADAMLRMWRAGLDVRFTVHDELGVYGTDKLEQMIEIMEETPAWAEGLPIALDGWSGEFYRK